MDDLLTALAILKGLLEDPDTKYPLSCEHDTLYVCGVDMSKVTANHVRMLDALGFTPGSDDDVYIVESVMGHEFAVSGYYDKISDEDWERLKDKLTTCFHSYRFGSC
jgi:hypothetical protein